MSENRKSLGTISAVSENLELDKPKSFGEIPFEKLETLQRINELINVFAQFAIFQNLIVAISFRITC